MESNFYDYLLESRPPNSYSSYEDAQKAASNSAFTIESLDFSDPYGNQSAFFLCRTRPGLCYQALLQKCSNYTKKQLEKWPQVWKWCGCHLPIEEYIQDALEYGLTPSCSSICRPSETIPRVDGTGIAFDICNDSFCSVANFSIYASDSFIGGLGLYNLCGSCKECSCVVENSDIISNSIISGTIKNQCSESSTYCIDPTSGKTTTCYSSSILESAFDQKSLVELAFAYGGLWTIFILFFNLIVLVRWDIISKRRKLKTRVQALIDADSVNAFLKEVVENIDLEIDQLDKEAKGIMKEMKWLAKTMREDCSSLEKEISRIQVFISTDESSKRFSTQEEIRNALETNIRKRVDEINEMRIRKVELEQLAKQLEHKSDRQSHGAANEHGHIQRRFFFVGHLIIAARLGFSSSGEVKSVADDEEKDSRKRDASDVMMSEWDLVFFFLVCFLNVCVCEQVWRGF
ncbi:hypothetical protein Gasu2_34330 [Galdieria sulphuraria]|nr:hypothetical protein Gasu2_34330 [Galdieria sulphuraria]